MTGWESQLSPDNNLIKYKIKNNYSEEKCNPEDCTGIISTSIQREEYLEIKSKY